MIHPLRGRRLAFLLAGIAALALGAALVLLALEENLQHFYSPTEVLEGRAPADRRFRLGGVVEEGSVSRSPSGLGVRFRVTDRFRAVGVDYEGILPDLFREGQSVVAIGRLAGGRFRAEQVLAKHDENYMPKEVAEAIARARARAAEGEARP
ncbi:MAG: cytochrome c maturation protein CcmE [Xanthomonadales bacterium]|nr:cytochrome c maturation protein CcmE [Xanthomonadales bacterium]